MSNGNGSETSKDLTVQLKGWMSTVVATLVSAVVSVGFVAFAGKAVLWSRFTALQVPADQVVKAVPQSEAVATGASILFIFGFFGALATVVFYLVDRGARATLGVGRALLGLVTLESIMAVVLAYEARSALLAAGVALALILVLSGAALVVTFVRRWVVQEDALRARPSEILRPARSASLLRDRTGEPRASLSKLLPLSAPPLVALGLIAVLFLVDQPAWLVAAMLFEIAVLVAVEWFMALDPRAEIRRSLAIELYLEALEEDKERSMDPRRAPTEKDKERKRVGKRRPYRFSLTFRGGFVMAMLALAVIVFPALILEEWWFAVSVGAAVVLSFGLWRIACLTKPGFIWFGLAVFLSVPLFGALTLMARNVNYPEAQPMALIRKTDGPDESIQGLYVAEANDRVYFANVATEGCGNEVKRHSGRLLWVPSDEVVAMSVGPLQSVKEASTSALEMAYELTPAVETPAAGAISLTGPEKQSKVIEKAEGKRLAKEVEEHAPGLDQRLQNPGPAVRPNFGSGLQLVPEVASPGKKVELRLSRLNGGGFGSRPRNRMLRLNGVPVKVERELTSEASAAEYVATVDGRVLALDKRGVFRRRDHKPEPLLRGEVYGGPLYVKLSDSLIEEVVNRHNGLARGYDSFLEISEGDDGDTLDPRYEPMVKLAGKREPTPLQSGLLRQAWHEGAIAFKVPRHARSGVVTIDCGQLAGSPLLRVATPPVARIEAQMRGGSAQVVLDGRRSRDAKGKRLVEHWKLGRRSLGKHERVMLRLQPRMRPYRVKLTVTNPEGVSGSAELLLLRLPGPLFAFGKATLSDEKQIAQLERARARLESFVRRSPPSLIELDGNADDVGSASFNVTLSLERAKQVRKALLTPPAHASGAIPASAIPVTLRAFGETCPIIRSPGRQATNRRVDIFVLGSDDRVIEPKGCRVGGEEHTTW